jgi:type VI secretion system protein ImpE
VLYAGASGEADETVRLGRFTDWRGGDGEPVRGVGQRTFLVGQESRTILEIQEITFNEPQAGAAPGPEPAP